MSLPDVISPPASATARVGLLAGSLFAMGVALAWTFLSMRVVMDVGGSCADGGPYVSAQSCPSGGGFVGFAIPLMLVAAFLGSFAAGGLSAPNLLVPMWLVLFGSLGWNFLEYGFTGDGAVTGWIVCGVVFELMALPALGVVVIGLRASLVRPDGPATMRSVLTWVVVYLVLGAAGALVGVVTFNAWTG